MPRVRRNSAKNQRGEIPGFQKQLPLDDGTITTPVTLAMISAELRHELAFKPAHLEYAQPSARPTKAVRDGSALRSYSGPQMQRW